MLNIEKFSLPTFKTCYLLTRSESIDSHNSINLMRKSLSQNLLSAQKKLPIFKITDSNREITRIKTELLWIPCSKWWPLLWKSFMHFIDIIKRMRKWDAFDGISLFSLLKFLWENAENVLVCISKMQCHNNIYIKLPTFMCVWRYRVLRRLYASNVTVSICSF